MGLEIACAPRSSPLILLQLFVEWTGRRLLFPLLVFRSDFFFYVCQIHIWCGLPRFLLNHGDACIAVLLLFYKCWWWVQKAVGWRLCVIKQCWMSLSLENWGWNLLFTLEIPRQRSHAILPLLFLECLMHLLHGTHVYGDTMSLHFFDLSISTAVGTDEGIRGVVRWVNDICTWWRPWTENLCLYV